MRTRCPRLSVALDPEAEPETIEANIVAAYDRDFASLLNDADHPCNWEPLER